MPKYIPYNYDQHSMVVINYQKQLQPGTFEHAIDGCKMSSDASKEWSGTFKELEQKRTKLKKLIHHHVTEHQKLDKNEPCDDERIKRTKQAINTLDKAYEKIDQFLKSHPATHS